MEPDLNRAFLSGPCNLLRPYSELSSGSAHVRWAVGMVGNWVGGRFWLTPEALNFRANALNARFQDNDDPVVIPLPQMDTVTQGRMLLVARTVDIATVRGTFRLRCRPSMTQRLFDALRARLGPLDTPPDGC